MPINQSSTPSVFKDHQTRSLETWSKGLRKSIDVKPKFFFLAECFSFNYLKIKMVSVVPHPGVGRDWISFVLTCYQFQ